MIGFGVACEKEGFLLLGVVGEIHVETNGILVVRIHKLLCRQNCNVIVAQICGRRLGADLHRRLCRIAVTVQYFERLRILRFCGCGSGRDGGRRVAAAGKDHFGPVFFQRQRIAIDRIRNGFISHREGTILPCQLLCILTGYSQGAGSVLVDYQEEGVRISTDCLHVILGECFAIHFHGFKGKVTHFRSHHLGNLFALLNEIHVHVHDFDVQNAVLQGAGGGFAVDIYGDCLTVQGVFHGTAGALDIHLALATLL